MSEQRKQRCTSTFTFTFQRNAKMTFKMQIEENTKVLASLGYRLGAPTPTPQQQDARPTSSSPKVHGRMTPSDKWRDGARKALLAWVKEVAHKYGHYKDVDAEL